MKYQWTRNAIGHYECHQLGKIIKVGKYTWVAQKKNNVTKEFKTLKECKNWIEGKSVISVRPYMKLFVWIGSELENKYRNINVYVLAENKAEALNKLQKENPFFWYVCEKFKPRVYRSTKCIVEESGKVY